MRSHRCVLEVLKFLPAEDVLSSVSQVSRLYSGLSQCTELWFDLLETAFATGPPTETPPKDYYRTLNRKVIPVVGLNSVRFFSVVTEKWTEKPLSTPVSIDRFASVVVWTGKRLFLTGVSDDLGDTLCITLRSGTVTYLSPLRFHRNSIGVVQVDGEIYSFCGFEGGYRRECEVFTGGKGWKELPNAEFARAAFNPAENNGKIYLMGGCGTVSNEYFDRRSVQFVSLPVVIPGQRCTVSVFAENDLIAVQNNSVFQFRLENPSEIAGFSLNCNLGKAFWSACAVVEHDGEIFVHQRCSRRIVAVNIGKKTWKQYGDRTE